MTSRIADILQALLLLPLFCLLLLAPILAPLFGRFGWRLHRKKQEPRGFPIEPFDKQKKP